MRVVVALVSGVLFGAGLAVAEMTNPAKVQSFLDVAGHWDPSLAFVMGTALVVTAAAWYLARRQSHSLLGEPLPGPPPATIDLRLVAGAATFGIGWGLSGLCPGPALAALVTGSSSVLVFVGSMGLTIFGMRRLALPASGARGGARG